MIAAVMWVKALKTERCFGSLSEENSLMWPIIVSAILRPLIRAFEEGDGQRFHITAHARHERQPPPQQLLGQFFANIAFVTEQFANQVFGQPRHGSGIADITFGQLEGHDLALMVEGLLMANTSVREEHLRQVVGLVAILNLAYFCVEFSVALAIGSVSLFADSIDFLEDTSVNGLILVALRWSDRWRARVGMALSGILLAPSIATLWTAWHKLVFPTPPEPLSLSLTGLGAFAVNLTCAFVLARYRHHSGSLTKAAFLSARNDVLANVAIIAAGFVTSLTASVWPDLIVGLGIGAINLDAARKVWAAARQEHLTAEA